MDRNVYLLRFCCLALVITIGAASFWLTGRGGKADDFLRVHFLAVGQGDAIFVVAGFPTGAIVELASAVDVKLVPIDGAGAKALTSKYGFFSQSPIPSGT